LSWPSRPAPTPPNAPPLQPPLSTLNNSPDPRSNAVSKSLPKSPARKPNAPHWLKLSLCALPLLLTACGTVREPLPPVVVAPPAIPPLPQSARQPALPEWCSPTCLEAWRKEAEKLLQP